MYFDYDQPEYSVNLRESLPASVKETLLEGTRAEWKDHPRFGGKANFFMTIHRDLLNGAAQLTHSVEQLLDVPVGEISETITRTNLLPFGRNLISFAHHHHEIEDHNYFPQFALMYPELNRALSVLDGDHKVVNASLDHTQKALDRFEGETVTRDQLAELYAGSKGLEKILNRHIWDEEEIIIPIFLRHG